MGGVCSLIISDFLSLVDDGTHSCWFVSGSNYGMADLHFYPVFERLPAIRMFGVDVFSADRFPRLGAWTSTMQQLDLVRKFWISPKMYYQFMVGRKAGDPPYDMETDDETMAVQNSVA